MKHPLYSNEITKIALERGWLKTAGKTPEASVGNMFNLEIKVCQMQEPLPLR